MHQGNYLDIHHLYFSLFVVGFLFFLIFKVLF